MDDLDDGERRAQSSAMRSADHALPGQTPFLKGEIGTTNVKLH